MRTQRRRRVFFVGAGLSAAFGYPLGAQLVSKVVEYLHRSSIEPRFQDPPWSRSDRRRAGQLIDVVDDTLRRYFGLSLEDQHGLDVASFFSVVHALQENPWLHAHQGKRAIANEPNASTLYADLAATTRCYFNDLWHASGASRDIGSFVSDLQWGSDVIVTFNWDEQLDWALTKIHPNEDVGYTLRSAQNAMGVPLLKPHGSIGWYDVQQGVRNDPTYFIAEDDERVPRAKQRIVSFTEIELPRDMDGESHSPLACPPLIAPPTFAKTFDYCEQQRVWEDVIDATRQADDLIFLGYAMPKDDFLTRAAISAALHDRDWRHSPLRCLVVDLRLDRSREGDLRRLFGGYFSQERNYMRWRFGTARSDFANKLGQKLERALAAH